MRPLTSLVRLLTVVPLSAQSTQPNTLATTTITELFDDFDQHQQYLAAAEMAEAEDKQIPDEFVKICMLTKLTEEEKTFLEAITVPDEESDNEWIKPQLVLWDSDSDGTVEGDMLRLYKQRTSGPGAENVACCYFADRQSVEEGGTIVANRDWYTLCISEQASAQLSALADAHGVELPTRDWAMMDGTAENMTEELVTRGLAWGREPGSAWRQSWANLDIGNMDLHELVELHGNDVHILLDPEWDVELFLKRLREELEKMKENGLWDKDE